MLIGWIVVQVLILQAFSMFQPMYLAVGAGLVATSHRLRLGPLSRGILFVATGAIVLAVGVGLVPHLLHPQVTLTAATAVAVLIGGFALTFTGARSAWRDQGILGRFTTVAGTVVLVALAVSVVAPAVAATRVAPTEITATPASVGLDAEAVTLRTSDDAELAAWYIGGTNRAGLVVMHGAGSTRSDVLEQSAALADAGSSLLLIDARGHGDSDGTAMDFGWYGDLDIAAETDYLASRPGIDPDRIGVVGFSMGAEEAIGADTPDRVTIWNVDDADHTGGFTTAPDEWRRHVLEFLDDHLR